MTTNEKNTSTAMKQSGLSSKPKNKFAGALARMFGGGKGTPKQKPYRSNITANRPFEGQQATPFAEQEKALAQTFASARGRLGRQEREASRGVEKGLQRLQSRVGTVGGSVEKARLQGLKDVQQAAGEAETQLAAQEQAAKGQLEQARTQFDQFKETMQFQKDSFADQMALQWGEFDETQKAQVINSLIALNDNNLETAAKFERVFGPEGGLAAQIFGSERVPQTYGSEFGNTYYGQVQTQDPRFR